MAAMIIHGVQPGPMLMVNQPQFVYDVVAMTLVATLAILLFGLLMVRPLLWVLRVPRAIIMPIVFVLCVLGSYLDRLAPVRRLDDAGGGIWPASCCAGWATRWRRSCSAWCSATSSTRACAAAWCSPTARLAPFFTRPISAVICAIVLCTVFMYVRKAWKRT